MKNLKLEFSDSLLSREELMQVKGGNASFEREGGKNRCCWNDNSSCSECSDGTWCVPDAHLVAC
jgi:hypothetical protein